MIQRTDLADLPAPQLFEEKSFDALLDSFIAAFLNQWAVERAADPDLPQYDVESLKSDPGMVAGRAFAARMLFQFQAGNDSARQLLAYFAEGANLDQVASGLGVYRLPGEDDEAMRARIPGALERPSTAGSRRGYEAEIKAKDSRIVAVGVFEADGPRVSIFIQARDGVASAELVAIAQAAVSAEDDRPMNDKPLVAAARGAGFSVGATLHLRPGVSAETAKATAQNAVSSYAAGQRYLGHDITRSGLIAALSVAGVRRVELTIPETDLVLDMSAFPVLVDLEVRIAEDRDV